MRCRVIILLLIRTGIDWFIPTMGQLLAQTERTLIEQIEESDDPLEIIAQSQAALQRLQLQSGEQGIETDMLRLWLLRSAAEERARLYADAVYSNQRAIALAAGLSDDDGYLEAGLRLTRLLYMMQLYQESLLVASDVQIANIDETTAWLILWQIRSLVELDEWAAAADKLDKLQIDLSQNSMEPSVRLSIELRLTEAQLAFADGNKAVIITLDEMDEEARLGGYNDQHCRINLLRAAMLMDDDESEAQAALDAANTAYLSAARMLPDGESDRLRYRAMRMRAEATYLSGDYDGAHRLLKEAVEQLRLWDDIVDGETVRLALLLMQERPERPALATNNTAQLFYILPLLILLLIVICSGILFMRHRRKRLIAALSDRITGLPNRFGMIEVIDHCRRLCPDNGGLIIVHLVFKVKYNGTHSGLIRSFLQSGLHKYVARYLGHHLSLDFSNTVICRPARSSFVMIHLLHDESSIKPDEKRETAFLTELWAKYRQCVIDYREGSLTVTGKINHITLAQDELADCDKEKIYRFLQL